MLCILTSKCMYRFLVLQAKVWRIFTSGKFQSLVPVAEASSSHFYSNECCVIQYMYRDDDEKECAVMYTWVGSKAKEVERAFAVAKATEMYEKMQGKPIHCLVHERAETITFLAMFKGAFIVRQVCTCTGVAVRKCVSFIAARNGCCCTQMCFSYCCTL